MNEIVIYQTDDGKNRVDIKLENGTLWLSQEQIGMVFNKAKSTINEHIKNIFDDGELDKSIVMKKFGNSEFSTKPTNYYNLDMVIAVGYRVKSPQGVQFRKWATEILKEYMIKGFAMDDDRLKQSGGGDYWKELLDRIKDIRSSEKVFYRQVLDLYATSKDYDKNSDEAKQFFKIVQNKLHYATHGHTASELIYDRVSADKDFMGLSSFRGSEPTKAEAKIAKNYLSEDELKILNNLVSGYFDFAEVYAQRHEHLYMKDYVEHLDKILTATGERILQTAGTISHKQAMSKVDTEYKAYQEKTLSPVERDYLEAIKSIEKSIKTNGKK